ncbi:CpaF family protein [Nesterenkonia sp. NBAIMH1]|uniref:CpaF family protein n=1 Tax=Nesterenkonia sp. NBAIMH1 TaxID=2600320 RepID=UPI0011B4109A|nr:CpaF family protein [Nesterenkonia sp. NBAIMH1]
MSLSERLQAAQRRQQHPNGRSAQKSADTSADAETPEDSGPPPATRAAIRKAGGGTKKPAAPKAAAEPDDALRQLKDDAAATLFKRIGARLNDPSLAEHQLHSLVRAELNTVIEKSSIPLSSEERRRLTAEVQDDVLGYGPLQRLLDDPDVTEVMVNGPDKIYIEKSGQLQQAASRFASEEHLRLVIERIVSRIGRRIDESAPMVDARLLDGSRVNAVIPPLAFNGSSLTIRKFSKDPFKAADLVRFGTLSPEMVELLDACVAAKLNVIVSGGTGSGKTTLLNVLSSFIPEGERIVTIEDAVELQLQQDHVVRLESRPPNVEGKGEVSIRDLVRNSLRMRPDRIVVGEVRGGESLDMLQAMNTGHDGSLSTVHANSPRDAISRLETLVLMAGMDLPLRAIREQIASAVDVIVQLTRLRDGTRRVTAVTEVHGMEGQTVTLQDVFLFDYSAGVDESGTFLGKPVSTGIRPRFTDRFEEMGITVSPHVFAQPPAGTGR